ncbi:hypothetical protein N9159_00535 [bacterium]|nr:hypothetical protein [bacterium]
MTTQARELAKLVSNSGDLNFIDDIALGSDGAVLTFGADSEITLTHVHNNGLLLNSTKQLQFGDSGTYIHQSADGVLDLVSDTEIELNATTIDINGAVDVSGTVTAPNFTGTASLATAITITANNTADETVFPVFVDGATGTQGLETDTGFTYNPNTNTLSVVNLSVSGTNTIVDSVTMNASNAVIFEGSSADAHETTLTSANATADRTITLPNLTGTVSLLDASETLTNKTLTSPVISTITGSTITLDSAGDIVLDAGGADVVFKDDGTTFSKIINSSGHVLFSVETQDRNINFNGNDDGSVITALTLDMSDAGTAQFNKEIDLLQSNHLRWKHAVGGTIRASIDADSNDNLMFYTGSSETERMRIDASGLVGIGTASPRGLLEVGNAAGTTDVDQKLYITGDQVNASGNFATLVLSNSNRSGSSSSQISAGRDVDNIGTTLQFYTHPTSGSETERLRIDSSGRILIAATAAAVHGNVDDLQIGNGVGNRGIGIHSANDANGAIFFSDPDSSLSGQIEYTHANNAMSFVTAGTQRMRLTTDGDVIIGNSTTVRRDLGSNTAPTLSLEGAFPAINLRDTSGTGAFYGINGDTLYLGGHSNTALLNLYVGGQPLVAIAATGATLPGTTEAFCTLEVGRTGTSGQGSAVLNLKSQGASFLNFYDVATNTMRLFSHSVNARWKDVPNNDDSIQFEAAGNIDIDGSYLTGGFDYAEYFESTDGTAIPVGTSVVLVNEKVRAATSGEQPLGVVRPGSDGTSVVGGSAGLRWAGKYLKDDYDAYLYDTVDYWIWKDVGDTNNTGDEDQQCWSDRVPSGWVVPSDKTVTSRQRKRLNPAFVENLNSDGEQIYVNRESRNEWNCIGLLGQVPITKGQVTNSNWTKLKDRSAAVELWFIK